MYIFFPNWLVERRGPMPNDSCCPFCTEAHPMHPMSYVATICFSLSVKNVLSFLTFYFCSCVEFLFGCLFLWLALCILVMSVDPQSSCNHLCSNCWHCFLLQSAWSCQQCLGALKYNTYRVTYMAMYFCFRIG